MPKYALVTGCSSGGIGAAIAKSLAAHDYTVFATLRDTSKAPNFSGPNIHILPLDVTSATSIAACVDKIQRRTGGRLDVLVNNAGADFVMPLLDVEIQEARELFGVNVWGVLATTKAFSHMLVEARGVLCNVGSVAGVMSLAWGGVYHASKAAMTVMSETLRLEMKPLGVTVLTAMVGSMERPIHAKAGDLNLPSNSYYSRISDTINNQRKGLTKPGARDPNMTANSIVSDIIGGYSGMIWRGGMATFCRWATWLLPTPVFDYLMNYGRGLSEVKIEDRETHS